MPGREFSFQTNCIYHLYNKSIDLQIFSNQGFCKSFIETCYFYNKNTLSLSFSHYKRIQNRYLKSHIQKQLQLAHTKYVDIYAFCLMPNHYHFLVKQKTENGISNFISVVTNSFTHYYNTLSVRKGPIFLPKFRAKQISTESEFRYVSRYIHLNPYSSSLVNSIQELEQYQWSSFKGYLTGKNDTISIVELQTLLSLFQDQQEYIEYVLNFAEEQKRITKLKQLNKHLVHQSYSTSEVGL